VTSVRDIEPKLVLRKLSNKHITDKNVFSSRHIEVFTTETVQPAKSILELEYFLVQVFLQDIFFFSIAYAPSKVKWFTPKTIDRATWPIAIKRHLNGLHHMSKVCNIIIFAENNVKSCRYDKIIKLIFRFSDIYFTFDGI